MRDYYQIHEEISEIFRISGISLFNVSEIRLPKDDYKEFFKETKEKGFSVTWWEIPVVEHDINSIFVVMK